MRMTTEEAFVKVLQMHGIEHAFGIIGSAMMPISDLFCKRVSSSGTAHMKQMQALLPMATHAQPVPCLWPLLKMDQASQIL